MHENWIVTIAQRFGKSPVTREVRVRIPGWLHARWCLTWREWIYDYLTPRSEGKFLWFLNLGFIWCLQNPIYFNCNYGLVGKSSVVRDVRVRIPLVACPLMPHLDMHMILWLQNILRANFFIISFSNPFFTWISGCKIPIFLLNPIHHHIIFVFIYLLSLDTFLHFLKYFFSGKCWSKSKMGNVRSLGFYM